MEFYIIYYIFLLLVFFYFTKCHFPRMTSIPVPTLEPTPVPVPASDPNDQAQEIPEDEFYHHPVWPERWNNPEFTIQARRKWIYEPWYKSTDRRDSHRFITQQVMDYSFPWGFIIYRTVYTTESDELWPVAMEKINHELKSSIECSLKHDSDDSSPEQLIQASHKDAVICDESRWDGASIEQVREHFAEYLRKTGQEVYCATQRYALCLVIDERALKSIVAPGKRAGFVEAVDGRFDPAKRYEWPGYRGHMRVQIRSLWEVYLNTHFHHMDEVCPSVPDGWIPVYVGGNRVGQDESGQIERDFSQQRPPRLPGLGRGRGWPTS